MADHTAIEWTDATWNPVTGCAIKSPGCAHCYAMKLAGTRLRHHPSRAGLTADSKAGPVWTGEVRLNEQWLSQPLGWKRPRRIFVCAHGDLFAEGVPDAWIDRVFAVMAEAPHHTFQVPTKRAARMRAYLSAPGVAERIGRVQRAEHGDNCAYTNVGMDAIWPLPNVWLGVSAEDQARADERIPDLLQTPAARRFLSAEPLLGPIDLTAIKLRLTDADGSKVTIIDPLDALRGMTWTRLTRGPYAGQKLFSGMAFGLGTLDWVIGGGESGDGARPVHPDWVRSLRDQCKATDIAFFFKQWGEFFPTAISFAQFAGDPRHTGVLIANADGTLTPYCPFEGGIAMRRVGKKAAGRILDGVEHDALPSSTRSTVMNVAARMPAPAIIRPIAHLPVFAVTGRDTIAVRAGASIDGIYFPNDTPVELPALEPGHDYAIVLVDGRLQAGPCDAIPGPNIVGGFHFAPGGGADGIKGGDAVPAINPFSIWDAGFRPACPDPRGMALVDGRFWCDIYLTAKDHREGSSRISQVIADGVDAPVKIGGGEYSRFDFETAKAVLAAHSKRLPTAEEFFALAYGVTERSAAGRDPKKTGLDAARTSRWGIMQATGNLWVWGTDGHPDDPRPSLFGGSWFFGVHAGSRCAILDLWPGGSSDNISARGLSDHLTLE